MSQRGIVQLDTAALATLPAVAQANASLGLKAGGYVHLMDLQPYAPVPYHIIDNAAAIPPMVVHPTSEAELRDEFQRIVALTQFPTPWLARSSDLKETPGKNESPPILIDPADKEISWKRFYGTVSRMLGSNPEMGILLMPMLGAWRMFEDETRGYGHDIVSFYADTVDPTCPDEMFIAFAQGLGHAIADTDEVVIVSVNREFGNITFLGNVSPGVLMITAGSTKVPLDIGSYRQSRTYYFSASKNNGGGNIKSRALGYRFFERPNYGMMYGRLHEEIGVRIGVIPFRNLESIPNLISILQYIHETSGSSQIEGAFLTDKSPHPHLYQHIHVPEIKEEDRPLAIENPHFVSNRVVGRGQFQGPLLVATLEPESFHRAQPLEDIDGRLADTGYILISPNHGLVTWKSTPNARFRLSGGQRNLSAHAATDLRYKLAKDRDLRMGMAHSLTSTKREKPEPAWHQRPYTLYPHARLDMNGREVAVEILPGE